MSRSVFDHLPYRGSDVETWVKAFRDQCSKGTPWFASLDELLDDYRLRCDTGLTLREDIVLAGESGAER